MRRDREDIRVFIESLKHRPDLARRMLLMGGLPLLALLALGLILLTSGRAAPKPETAEAPPGPPGATGEYRSAFKVAEAIEPMVRGDRRFAGVAIVPTVGAPGTGSDEGGEAGARAASPRLMVMGAVRSEEDLAALRAVVESKAGGLRVDWAVAVSGDG